MSLRPLQEMPAEAARAVHTVLLDIDDTLTTHGRLTAEAYTALQRLQEAGLRVLPITGRPAGWCDHIARMWPVDGVVGENGAFHMWMDRAAGRLRRMDFQDAADSQAQRHGPHDTLQRFEQQTQARLAAVRERILREVPGCGVASDQFCRLHDLAIDFCEDVPPLPDAAVDRIAALMREAGMTAKVSSIHVNGWFGDWDKLAMTRRVLADRHGLNLGDGIGKGKARDLDRIVFVGDSPNDEPMFGFFPHAVGVANVADHLHRLRQRPAWITRERAGAGFAEVARHLIDARRP